MPYCPNKQCPKEWLWSWGIDILCNKDGREAPHTQIKHTPTMEVTIYRCTCGEFLGVLVDCECGLTVISCEEWQHVDWNLGENAYEE